MSEARFLVCWSEEAARDLAEITHFVSTSSPVNARKLLAQLRTRAATLERAPLRGRIVPELAGYGIRSWRELVVRPYRLVYRVASKKVFVLAVLDGRRDLEDILLERLLRGR